MYSFGKVTDLFEVPLPPWTLQDAVISSPVLLGSYNRRQFEAGSLMLMDASTSEFTKAQGAFPREERNIPAC